MARPEGWRLDRAAYPFSFVTETRFQDLDILGHINNVAMAALFENGRVRFNRSLGLFDRRRAGERWLIAAISINYLAEAHFPDDIEIASGVGHIGTRSWRIDAAAFQNSACVATCETTVVLTGPEGSEPLPDDMLAALTRHMVKQPG